MVKTNNLIGREIGAALKRLRKSQEWLAGEMSVSSNAVSKWIKFGTISRENAIQLSQILRIPLDKLLAGKDNVISEVLESLPFERSKSMLTQFMYQVEHADDVLTGENINRYLKAINSMIKDMERRRNDSGRS